MGDLKQTQFALLAAAGKGAPVIAEQFTFQELLGQSRTVDGDKRAFAAAGRMNGPGKQLLAGTAGPPDGDDGIGCGDLFGKGDCLGDDRMAPNDIAEYDGAVSEIDWASFLIS